MILIRMLAVLTQTGSYQAWKTVQRVAAYARKPPSNQPYTSCHTFVLVWS
jgi:hypothetical protein